MSYKEPFAPGQYYHVFNRAVGNEKMFLTEENYRYFLQRFQDYILPVADVFCYTLIPNHFHFFIRIKSEDAIISHYQSQKHIPFPQCKETLSGFVMDLFSNWCNSYTKSFNKMHGRKGKLFMDNLKRITITSDSSYSTLVLYIHNNCVKHRLKAHASDWPYSSYHAYLSVEKSWLSRKDLLEWFGGREYFIKAHQQHNLEDFAVFKKT